MKIAKRIEAIGALLVSRIPVAIAQRLRAPASVDGQTLDPHLRIILGVNKGRGGFEKRANVEAARADYRHVITMLEKPGPSVATRDQVVGDVPIRIYQPAACDSLPCVVYFHGGGYAIGDLETHDGVCSRFSHELQAIVIAVDYRLAPENPFPAGLDDCLAITRWVVDSAGELGIDSARIALAGDSAGGNYAAVISQEVPGIVFQLLIYPGTDARSKTSSKKLFADGYGLDKSTIDWFFKQYAQGEDRANPRISPAASTQLDRSPPTHIATAGFDVLRDEGRAYAELLAQANVACSHENHSTLSHGFIHFTRLPGCDAGLCGLIEVLRKGLNQNLNERRSSQNTAQSHPTL